MVPYEIKSIHLKAPRKGEHPWVFQTGIHKPEARLPPGSLVRVLDARGFVAGFAHYNGHARIALRMLSGDPDAHIDAAWFSAKLQSAHALRVQQGIPQQSNAYRVVHAEGDGLSGLIVDRFDDLLVTQFYSAGMFKMRTWIQAALDQLFPNARHYQFADRHVGKQESFDSPTPAAVAPALVQEHGLKFLASPGDNHKTGFFADQRDNRKLLSTVCTDARVLDLCCNTGGFAIYAKALGKAREVIGVDSDPQVLDIAAQNAAANQVQIDWRAQDLFVELEQLQHQRSFDVVVLDPAKMTRSSDGVEAAMRAYFAMNKRAIAAVKDGGWLLSCSCTGWVGEDEFLAMLRDAAYANRRQLQIVKISGAGGDHPISTQAPESRYLKAVLARVVAA